MNRLRALAMRPPSQSRRRNIVAIGASNTWGLGVGWDNAYPAELQGLLRKKGIDANVTHAGVLLDRTGWMLRRLDSAVPEGTHVILCSPAIYAFSEPRRSAPPISPRW